MIFRWADRPRNNVHVSDRPSIARLVHLFIAGIWLFGVSYGVACLLLAG